MSRRPGNKMMTAMHRQGNGKATKGRRHCDDMLHMSNNLAMALGMPSAQVSVLKTAGNGSSWCTGKRENHLPLNRDVFFFGGPQGFES